MSDAAIDSSVAYPFASTADDAGVRLAAHPGDGEDHVPLLRGRLRDAQGFAGLLGVLGDVVRSRHHLPPAMLQRILAHADPLITVGDGVVRFEGFSACCSCYARVDLLEEAYEADEVGHGTTNVDVGPGLRASLARLRQRGEVALTVTSDALTLATADGVVQERKIPLPRRWLEGLLHVAPRARALERRGVLSAAQAQRLVASLPTGATAGLHLVPGGAGWRLSAAGHPEGVRISGTSRVRALLPALRGADDVSLYASADGEATAWVVRRGPTRLTLVLSADVWRGFSGEGSALSAMAAAHPADIARWRAALRWQARIPDATEAADRAALAALASQGLVGFDVTERAWFHRVLPWDPADRASKPARLRSAERLVEDEAVMVDANGLGAVVAGRGASYRVDLRGGVPTCTCPWFARTGGARGPCSHVLAAASLVAARGAP